MIIRNLSNLIDAFNSTIKNDGDHYELVLNSFENVEFI